MKKKFIFTIISFMTSLSLFGGKCLDSVEIHVVTTGVF